MKIAELKIFVASALLFMTASAQALQPEVLYSFPSGMGSPSKGRLVQGSDGNFYGTTIGVYDRPWTSHPGTVFRVTTNGVFTSLASFNLSNGEDPVSEMVLGPDGNFYGTGDSSIGGMVFRVTTNGVLTTWAAFTGTNGGSPFGGLVLGPDGNFYGTTLGGGSSGDLGTVFQVTINGVVTSLVSFTGTNGAHPFGGLVLGIDGFFYGTTGYGGSDDRGTVFKVTSNGVLTTLVSFTGDNGGGPSGRLILAHDGNFYGSAGTVFKVTTNGVLTTLVSFNGTNDAPQHRMVLGRDGHIYGTTANGGTWSYGTVFKVTTNGVLTTLVSFDGTNGAHPQAGLVLGNDGYFYGTTENGGPGGGGTVFRLVVSPRFASVARQPGGSVLLTGTGPANGSYRLWASTDLSLPVASWTLLTSAPFDSNGNFSYTDTDTATNPSRFYQLSMP
jgi:uncharacterized repeat protein (TIGR03803 family)